LSLEYGKIDVVFNSVLMSALDARLCSFEPWHVLCYSIFMIALWNRADYIVALWFLLSCFLSFFIFFLA